MPAQPAFGPQPAHYQSDMFSAPIKGLTVRYTLDNQDQSTALMLRNVLCRRYGVELRKGYARWVSNLPGEVRAVMSYYPPRAAGSPLQPKLFAGCIDGNIYDVTAQQAVSFTPPIAQTLPPQTEPGVFSWTMFSAGGANFLVVCCAGAGVWTYDNSTGWVNRTNAINGTGGANLQFDFVMSWKNRLWFLADNSNIAWYLPVNSIQGQAQSFDFGPLLVFGGDVCAMASWTLDAGDGVDDKLVLVGRGGDVFVYEGTDPASASTFKIVGRWSVGKIPMGRRFMSKYGGDLMLITTNGIERMSQLTQARGLLTPGNEFGMDDWVRYMETIARAVRDNASSPFWSPVYYFGEQCLHILTPYNTAVNGLQYVYGTLSGGWSEFTGVPMMCAEGHDGDFYFGTPDGNVMKMYTGSTDDQLPDGTPGKQITATVQTSFVALSQNAFNTKRPLMAMPMFLAPSAPNVKAQINTDWSFQSPPGSPIYNPFALAQWDAAKWDSAVWGGANNFFNAWVGAEGLGTHCSLRMDFTGESPGTIFTAWKLLAETGRGVL